MRKVLLFAAFIALFLSQTGTCFAQTVGFTATRVPDITGAPLASGSLCFPTSSACKTVTSGAIPGSSTVTTGTGGLFVKNGSGTIIWQTGASDVTISTAFSFDNYVIPTGNTVTITGVPRGACALGATEIRTDLTPNVTYTCGFVGGQNVFVGVGSSSSTGAPSGIYAGNGVPTFACQSPCLYSRNGTPGFYTLSVPAGVTSATWAAVTGASGPTGPPWTFRGAYTAGTSYVVGDVVRASDGGAYSNILACPSCAQNPISSPTYWALAVQASTSGGDAAAYIQAVTPLIKNLFNPAIVTPTSVVYEADGTLLGGVGDHFTTGYVLVSGASNIISNEPSNDLSSPPFGYAFYDTNKSFISGGAAAANTAIAVPTGGVYYRQGVNNSFVSSLMIVAGTTMPGAYISFGYDDPATEARNIAAAITAYHASPIRFGVFGDSISAAFDDRWQTSVATKTGMSMVFEDAHSGRQLKDIFENFGGGDGAGTYSGTPVGGGAGSIIHGMTTGQTLAQAVANVDIMIIWLGTNDGGYYYNLVASMTPTPGTAGDTPSMTGSLSAVEGKVIQDLETANPAMKIVFITPYFDDPSNGHGGCNTVACVNAIVTAMVNEANIYAAPTLNMLKDAGINSGNWTYTLGDGLHPSNNGFDRFVSPAIAHFLLGLN